MELNEKLASLRRRSGYSQESLAEQLGISRQAVSKWEAGLTQPDVANLVALSDLYGVTLDHLLKDAPNQPETPPPAPLPAASVPAECPWQQMAARMDGLYEYKSKRTLFGLPLVHVCLGRGRSFSKGKAKGIIAVGNRACGVVSVGFFGAGLFNVALVGGGLVSLGLVSVGGLALGTFACGIWAAGNIALGLFAQGNVALGQIFASGNVAVSGSGVAVGNAARGAHSLSIGDGMATPQQKQQAFALARTALPWLPEWINQLMLWAM